MGAGKPKNGRKLEPSGSASWYSQLYQSKCPNSGYRDYVYCSILPDHPLSACNSYSDRAATRLAKAVKRNEGFLWSRSFVSDVLTKGFGIYWSCPDWHYQWWKFHIMKLMRYSLRVAHGCRTDPFWILNLFCNTAKMTWPNLNWNPRCPFARAAFNGKQCAG